MENLKIAITGSVSSGKTTKLIEICIKEIFNSKKTCYIISNELTIFGIIDIFIRKFNYSITGVNNIIKNGWLKIYQIKIGEDISHILDSIDNNDILFLDGINVSQYLDSINSETYYTVQTIRNNYIKEI